MTVFVRVRVVDKGDDVTATEPDGVESIEGRNEFTVAEEQLERIIAT